MAQIYSAVNPHTGDTVGLYHDTIKSRYEVVVRGLRVRTITCESLAMAYHEYNLALR